MNFIFVAALIAIWMVAGFSAWWSTMTKYEVWRHANSVDYAMGAAACFIGPLAWLPYAANRD